MSPALSFPTWVTGRAPDLCPRGYVLGKPLGREELLLLMVCIPVILLQLSGVGEVVTTLLRPDETLGKGRSTPRVVQAGSISTIKSFYLDPSPVSAHCELKALGGKKQNYFSFFLQMPVLSPQASAMRGHLVLMSTLVLLRPWEVQGPDHVLP